MTQELKKIHPRHIEIMRRLCLGESQRDVARGLDITEGRLSIIVNSPLFQLELRKMQKRFEDRVSTIHERLISNAEKASLRQEEMLQGFISVKDDNKVVQVPIGVRTIETAANSSLNLFLKLQKGGPASLEDGEDCYESRLEREVIFRETHTSKKHSNPNVKEVDEVLSLGHPDPTLLDDLDNDVLDIVASVGA